MQMNRNLNDLLIIDEQIGDFYYSNSELSLDDFMEKFNKTNYVEKALKIIHKLSRENIIELLRRSTYLTDFIDLQKYIKGYPLNKTYLKQNKDMYIEEYKKLWKTCHMISDHVHSDNEFQEYMDALKIDDVEEYLLTNMPNEQIYALASETSVWHEKLYYFSFLKK